MPHVTVKGNLEILYIGSHSHGLHWVYFNIKGWLFALLSATYDNVLDHAIDKEVMKNKDFIILVYLLFAFALVTFKTIILLIVSQIWRAKMKKD